MKISRLMSGIAAVSCALLALSGCQDKDGGSSAGGSDFDPGARITMVVPMAPGGGSDMSGRAIASGLENVTGKSISVENRQGAGGAVGYAAFLGEEGDTSKLLATETALINLPLTENVPFTWRSFTPIMKVGQDSTIMVVKKGSPYNSCRAVVDAAKAGSVKVSISGGVTGNDAIQFGLIEKDQGVQFQRVPYESGGEAVTALLGGHVDVALGNPSEVMGQLEAGDLVPLCVISDERYHYDALKDIPTTVEEGINVTFSQFRGLIAPGGISDEAREYWIDAAKKYSESKDFTSYMETNFMQIDPLFGDDFVKYLEEYEADLKKGLGQS
ncbi:MULTISPECIES: tripartite tricarboxylate transporter substrate binding protein [Actinotignum]|uniref:Tripartite tricarboxylate transporter substrate binding protein n=2 Tax=Actinotignum timonense TaxID=1870995 RepID=A0ABU5GEH3_9ACTO|nr:MULTISPECIES: tripartite tricarboxylate transporter substrate binding protein [Actinotignum]MDE1558158.1 tripartite tricarboxylate transporter substrate binding protein [Actinotignum schaalii]MDE1662808.1 tripartite tricarboxylate transporter substrate binding protein [Actinotignum schaalii]MDK6372976.1 tripartite tricarboxylate transporter substrate binding protein [Actinotignum timonense]MDK6419010.1 tripartite tricarboxylate transporter substrate binding protein [Actinotignum timonense]M